MSYQERDDSGHRTVTGIWESANREAAGDPPLAEYAGSGRSRYRRWAGEPVSAHVVVPGGPVPRRRSAVEPPPPGVTFA